MARGLRTAEVEQAREVVENDLALLGTVRVRLHLVHERLAVLARVTEAELVLPAVEDLRQADRDICKVQERIRARGP